MSDLAAKMFETLQSRLEGEYDQIPESVRDQLPRVFELLAASALDDDLTETANVNHALAVTANVKVGGRIALNQLVLESARDVLARAVTFVKGLLS